jgi:phosphoglycolate phosphatase-like HAD superfamily hydrolase
LTGTPQTTVLFWDLDGTLLKTGRAGILAFEDAMKEVTGIDVELEGMFTSGLTDWQVGELILRTAGSEPEPAVVEALLRSYERGLPEALPKRQGEVLPNVREVLTDLEDHPTVRSLLLTGNTPAGARAKLAYYGLDRYFGDEGGFSTGPESRPEIGRRALQLAGHADAVFVIGDTPHDVECGRAIDAKTVAVASGWHTPDELAACDPWLLLEQIPEPGRFRLLLGLDG